MITVSPPNPVSINSLLEKSANIDNAPRCEHRFWVHSRLQTCVLSTYFHSFLSAQPFRRYRYNWTRLG